MRKFFFGPLLRGECCLSRMSVTSQYRRMTYDLFRGVSSVTSVRDQFSHLKPGERDIAAQRVCFGGRIVSIRDLGKILFVTLRTNGELAQICVNVGSHFSREELNTLKSTIKSGDVVGAEGVVGRTKQGEITLFASSVRVLAPYVCSDLTVIPDQRTFESRSKKNECSKRSVIADPDLKFRYRFVDLITDPSSVKTFQTRHKIIQTLRQFLDSRGFVEVETPVFHTVPCGANARPFTTHHNANDADLFLRVAPELYLKQCVVGGLDRVYEIGKVFRNEDADRSHNPEFTSCEFYSAYSTYEDLMPMTEDILRQMATAVNQEPKMEIFVEGSPVVIDLSKPFKRVRVYEAVQEAAGVTLPPPTELDTPTGMAFMAAIMLQHRIPLPSVRTASKFFDKLIDHFVTDRLVEPTFVCDHPLFMSPLARESSERPGISERFELFINGMEICNSYSELNDPVEQLRRFELQMKDKDLGDDEAMSLDETFLKALQTGLPPTAGWGMGIDRVVMLLTKSKSIRDVILFPLLRPDDSHDAKRRHKTASFFGFNQQMTLFCLSGLEAELQRRGELGVKVEHLKALRRTVLELSRRRSELEEQLEKCREAAKGDPCAPTSLWVQLLRDILCGRGSQ